MSYKSDITIYTHTTLYKILDFFFFFFTNFANSTDWSKSNMYYTQVLIVHWNEYIYSKCLKTPQDSEKFYEKNIFVNSL